MISFSIPETGLSSNLTQTRNPDPNLPPLDPFKLLSIEIYNSRLGANLYVEVNSLSSFYGRVLNPSFKG